MTMNERLYILNHTQYLDAEYRAFINAVMKELRRN